MRTLVLAAIGLVFLLCALPSRAVHAQDGSGIAQLSSAAYAPDSPVRENKLFQYQTGHYGFAYNCDGEEDKRNNPAICWRKADQPQLPKRMGCLERVRHEVAQVSRRILDGMCDTGCEGCQQPPQSVTRSCGCENCMASQDSEPATSIDSFTNLTADQTPLSDGLLATEQSESEQAIEVAAQGRVLANRRGSGLVSVTRLESAAEVEVLVGSVKVVPVTLEPPVEFIRPPVARITSATFGSGVESVIEAASEATANDVAEVSPPAPSKSTHQMGLLERLKRIQSAQGSALLKPAKF